MASGKFVVYLRVSTDRQGASGLGIEAQRKAVTDYLNGGRWKLVAEFVEVESGKNCDRPQLAEAIKACRAYGAHLLIAKLDRLSRDAHFLLGLEKAGVEFTAADMPNANRLTVGIMAMVAEEERRMISARTKAALQAAKARGTKLGGYRGGNGAAIGSALGVQARQARSKARAADLAPIVAQLRADGVTSLRGLAKGLSERGIETAQGGATWSAVQVGRLLVWIDPPHDTQYRNGVAYKPTFKVNQLKAVRQLHSEGFGHVEISTRVGLPHWQVEEMISRDAAEAT